VLFLRLNSPLTIFVGYNRRFFASGLAPARPSLILQTLYCHLKNDHLLPA
jgi:hypothetical protein